MTVVPATLMLYDYVILAFYLFEFNGLSYDTLAPYLHCTMPEVGHWIHRRSHSTSHQSALLWDWNTSNEDQFLYIPISNGSYNSTLRLLQLWLLSIGTWLVHIILQMRVYILHDRSRRILFIVVLGFIIEVAVSLVTMIRVSIFQANSAVNQAATLPAAFPASETIDIYVYNAISLFYEFLLFSLALWATIRYYRCSLAANQIGARNLRVVLIEGNVMYFLALLDSRELQDNPQPDHFDSIRLFMS
ncbi:hypothetical protein V8B97DRAFT_2083015 [Scleroderma yunnanense]